MNRPSGTLTFLFTDIEGSTRRWEADEAAMRQALEAHDRVLRRAIDLQGGWLFKHTGDGVCAAFSSAQGALDAALAAQRALQLPVRMGLATGEAQARDDDYFGPALNRAARIMAAAHGGQILCAASTQALLHDAELRDLGEFRLRDLSLPTRLFQVLDDALRSDFPPPRTLDATPGNLPVQATSFVGRDDELKDVIELVRSHRLVTLTGVGGVGKTRLALQAAAELAGEFADGAWFIELAPLAEPNAVLDVTLAALDVAPQAGRSPLDSLIAALSGRAMLIVIDNCEHLLDAAADLVEALLQRTTEPSLVVTSREGLRVAGEQLWPVPSLPARAGSGSAAVALFDERARAVLPSFELDGPGVRLAVTEICQRLDGIPLAIELAAARMVSMTPQDVRDRLGDRFRLLSGARRGLERHQTLRNAVGWSFDLLSEDEQRLLGICSVFADGFDVEALAAVAELDDYDVLDRLDSLVRKSLVGAQRIDGSIRYGMLETIRQFAEDQLRHHEALAEHRHRHAAFYALGVRRQWDRWNGPHARSASEWIEREMANLRIGFRHAADQGQLEVAARIAAHTAMIAVTLERYEPVIWAEEILPAAERADIAELPRLFSGAMYVVWLDRLDDAVRYADAAITLERGGRHDSFEAGWSAFSLGNAHRFAGRLEQSLAIYHGLAATEGLERVVGLMGLTWLLAQPVLGRTEEAVPLAHRGLDAARTHGSLYWIAGALAAKARALRRFDLEQALAATEEGRRLSIEHRFSLWEAVFAREAAGLAAVLGDHTEALRLFSEAVESFHRSGNNNSLIVALVYFAEFLGLQGSLEEATVLHAALAAHPIVASVTIDRAAQVQQLAEALGQDRFRTCCERGVVMTLDEVVGWTRRQIDQRRHRPVRS